MDIELLKRIAASSASEDLLVSVEALRELRNALSPANLGALLDREPHAAGSALLEAIEVGNTKVLSLLCDAIVAAFGANILGVHDAAVAAIHFLVILSTSSMDECSALGSRALRTTIHILLSNGTDTAVVRQAGELVEVHLASACALRLIDEADVSSAENKSIAIFLRDYSPKVCEWFWNALGSSGQDPLLAIATGVATATLSRHWDVHDSVIRWLTDSIGCTDSIAFPFACRAAAALIEGHARNCQVALLHGWVTAAAEHLIGGCGKNLSNDDAAMHLLSAAASFPDAHPLLHRWDSRMIANYASKCGAEGKASVLLYVARCSQFRCDDLIGVDHYRSSFWAMRLHVDSTVRWALWTLTFQLLSTETFSELAPSVASFLLGNFKDEPECRVREVQLKCAERCADARAAAPFESNLRRLIKGGLYQRVGAVMSDSQQS
jgi:hypothetical protein